MYEIAKYDDLYRPYDKSGNELKHADWVKLPARPKGDGLQELFEYKRGLEIFAIWCLLLEKTTAEKKPENRGKLLNRHEEPATAEEIAKGISLKTKGKLVGYALSVLTTMGWLKSTSTKEESSAQVPQSSPKSIILKSSVLKSREEKYTKEFLGFWNKYPFRWIKESGKKVKVGKQLAWEQWQKINSETRKQILEIVPVFARKIDSQSVPDPWRWLRDKKYLDYISEPPSEVDEKKEQENLEKKRQQIRDEYGSYYRSLSVEELQEALKAPALTTHHWLIKEILEK